MPWETVEKNSKIQRKKKESTSHSQSQQHYAFLSRKIILSLRISGCREIHFKEYNYSYWREEKPIFSHTIFYSRKLVLLVVWGYAMVTEQINGQKFDLKFVLSPTSVLVFNIYSHCIILHLVFKRN